MTNLDTPAEDAPVADPAPVATEPTAPVAGDDAATTNETDEATKKLKKEAQQQRAARRAAEARLAELEAAEEARKNAELSEAEQAKKAAEAAESRAAALEQQVRETKVNAAIEKAARAAGYADETDALQLAASIKLDDDGEPVGVTEAVTALLVSKPHYAAKPGTPRLDTSNGGRQEAAPLTAQQQTQNLWATGRGPSIWNIPTVKK